MEFEIMGILNVVNRLTDKKKAKLEMSGYCFSTISSFIGEKLKTKCQVLIDGV